MQELEKICVFSYENELMATSNVTIKELNDYSRLFLRHLKMMINIDKECKDGTNKNF